LARSLGARGSERRPTARYRPSPLRGWDTNSTKRVAVGSWRTRLHHRPQRLRPSTATGSTARSHERRQRESFKKCGVSRQT
jgi:hypothetical protein